MHESPYHTRNETGAEGLSTHAHVFWYALQYMTLHGLPSVLRIEGQFRDGPWAHDGPAKVLVRMDVAFLEVPGKPKTLFL